MALAKRGTHPLTSHALCRPCRAQPLGDSCQQRLLGVQSVQSPVTETGRSSHPSAVFMTSAFTSAVMGGWLCLFGWSKLDSETPSPAPSLFLGPRATTLSGSRAADYSPAPSLAIFLAVSLNSVLLFRHLFSCLRSHLRILKNVVAKLCLCLAERRWARPL